MHHSPLTDTYPAVPNTFPSRPRNNPFYGPEFNAAALERLTPEYILSRLAQPPPVDAYWQQPYGFPKRNIDIHISETFDILPDHVYPIYRYPNVAERTVQQNRIFDEPPQPMEESVSDNSVESRADDKTAAMTKNALEIAQSIDALMKFLLVGSPTEGDAVPATEESWPFGKTAENAAEETDFRKLYEEYRTRREKEITEYGVGRQASEEEAQTTNPATEPEAEEVLTGTGFVSTPETEEESSSETATAVTEETAARGENDLYRFEVGSDGLKIISLTDKESGPTKMDEKPEFYDTAEETTTVSEGSTEDELSTTPKLAEVVEIIESSEEIQPDKLDLTLSTAKLELLGDSNMTNNIDTNEIPNVR